MGMGIGCRQACLLDHHAAAIEEQARLLPVLRLPGPAGKGTQKLRQRHGAHQQLLRPLKQLGASRISALATGVGVGVERDGRTAQLLRSASTSVQVPARRCTTRRFTRMPCAVIPSGNHAAATAPLSLPLFAHPPAITPNASVYVDRRASLQRKRSQRFPQA